MAERFVVLHVFGAMDAGGAELRTLEMLPGLRRSHLEPWFFTLSGRRGELARNFEVFGGKVLTTDTMWRAPFALYRTMRSLRPDAVHSHVATMSAIVLLIALTARVPQRIAHARSDGDGRGDGLPRRVRRAVLRAVIRRAATDVVGVTPEALTFLVGSGRVSGRTHVIPNGVDRARLTGPTTPIVGAAGRVELVHVGRAAPEKNRAFCPRVLAGLRRRGVPAHLTFVGPRGDHDDALVIAAAARAGVADDVTLEGPSDALGEVLHRASCLLLPSLREGLPGVVLEALAVGTPVVANDLSGVRYIAAAVPGIRVVGLDQGVEPWTRAVELAVAEGRDPECRRRLRDAFDAGPFGLEAAVDAHRRLYGLGAST